MMDTANSPTSTKNVLMMDQTAAQIPTQLEMTVATGKTISKCATLMEETAVLMTKSETATVIPSTSIECVGTMTVIVLVNTT